MSRSGRKTLWSGWPFQILKIIVSPSVRLTYFESADTRDLGLMTLFLTTCNASSNLSGGETGRETDPFLYDGHQELHRGWTSVGHRTRLCRVNLVAVEPW